MQIENGELFYARFLPALAVIAGLCIMLVAKIEVIRTYETTGTIVDLGEAKVRDLEDNSEYTYTRGKIQYVGRDEREYFHLEEVPSYSKKGDSIVLRVYKSRNSKAFVAENNELFEVGLFISVIFGIAVWQMEWIMKLIKKMDKGNG